MTESSKKKRRVHVGAVRSFLGSLDVLSLQDTTLTRHYEGPRCPMRHVFRPMLGDERSERLCKRTHVLHEAELIVDELQAPFGLLQPLHAILGQFARPYGVCGQQRRVELG